MVHANGYEARLVLAKNQNRHQPVARCAPVVETIRYQVEVANDRREPANVEMTVNGRPLADFVLGPRQKRYVKVPEKVDVAGQMVHLHSGVILIRFTPATGRSVEREFGRTRAFGREGSAPAFGREEEEEEPVMPSLAEEEMSFNRENEAFPAGGRSGALTASGRSGALTPETDEELWGQGPEGAAPEAYLPAPAHVNLSFPRLSGGPSGHNAVNMSSRSLDNMRDGRSRAMMPARHSLPDIGAGTSQQQQDVTVIRLELTVMEENVCSPDTDLGLPTHQDRPRLRGRGF